MLMLLFLACGGAGGGVTIDLVDGTYRGKPADGQPEDGVQVRDADSTFTVAFSENDGELWADLAFRGDMVIHGFPIEKEDNVIEGVTVDGIDLACAIVIEGFSFAIEGAFSADRASLAIDVQHVGTMTLGREEEESEDTGAV